MSARPLIPGRAYSVRHQGRSITVLAAGPCEAILRVLDLLGVPA
jgi:hypothetical protein